MREKDRKGDHTVDFRCGQKSFAVRARQKVKRPDGENIVGAKRIY